MLGVDHEELRALLEPHGRVEDLEVAGQRVGLRLCPRDRAIRELAPAGIEFAPPRRERSTGPGRHDFEIVVDASASGRGRPRAARLHGQRDRAAARRRRARRSVRRPGGSRRPRPAHGVAALARRGSAAHSCAGCASSRSSTSRPTTRRCAQMQEEARERAARLGRADRRRPAGGRHGRAVEAAARPEGRRRRCGSRATPASSSRSSPSSRRRSATTPTTRARAAPVDEHVFTVVAARAALAARAARGAAARPRQAARRRARARRRRERASPTACSSACATRRGCAATSSTLVARARVPDRRRSTSCSRAASSASTATSSRATSSRTRRPISRAKNVDDAELERTLRLARADRAGGVAARTGSSDLAVDGIGPARARLPRGPAARRACSTGLLDEVVDDPSRNAARVAARAREGAARVTLPALGRAGPVRGRVHDARRRRERGAVRVAQPRPEDRRRRRARRREPPPRVCRDRRRRRAARAQLPGPLDARAPRARRARAASAATGSGRTSRDLPILAMSADCLPIALARDERRRAGGRRGARRLARPARRDRRERGRRARRRRARGRDRARRSGRAATRCATTSPIRSARASARDIVERREARSLARGRGGAARRGRRRASTASTSARRAARSSSSRTAATASRAASRECSRVSPDEIRERYERIKAEVGPSVTVVAATKYVSVDELEALADGGRRGRRREPRAGSRGEARALRRPLPLALHRPPAEPQGDRR